MIGGARRVDADNLTLNGTLRGALTQVGANVASGFNTQVINIGGAHNARARNVNANGTVNGVVNQIGGNVGVDGSVQSAVVGGVQGATVSGNDEAK